jgi:hypothetical protein
MLTKKGEAIVCSQGHDCGSVDADIADGEPITPNDLLLHDAGNHDLDGHFCPTCKERVTKVRDGLYSAHTAGGWVGTVP